MKISHEEYLERTLKSKRIELENLNIMHRVAIATYEAKKEMLQKEMDSIERQLVE
ncbi:hypothetical protein KIH86_24035 [Paenibacillus sp. HN-1]|uniref:hypothetical protein n=1 Tax=Paenibacillus TaxID=44249 RepID=UPI001CA99000|nr:MULTISPECIES: hypothetical protein [Paenibacillus]MBY9081221.1 hypothetical protein [Paenibacillus sp. CGMCC 1.18879]MBY9087258.1 hypothetical protein [Paenibacillus sinensis]